MKKFFAFLILTTGLAQAMPYTCESLERKEDGSAVMRFRINNKVSVEYNGSIWKHYLIGVTREDGFRFRTYGSGQISESEIGLSFVQKGYVTGYVRALSFGEEGIYEGEAKLSDVNHSRLTEVRCVNDKK